MLDFLFLGAIGLAVGQIYKETNSVSYTIGLRGRINSKRIHARLFPRLLLRFGMSWQGTSGHIMCSPSNVQSTKAPNPAPEIGEMSAARMPAASNGTGPMPRKQDHPSCEGTVSDMRSSRKMSVSSSSARTIEQNLGRSDHSGIGASAAKCATPDLPATSFKRIVNFFRRSRRIFTRVRFIP